MHEKIVWGESFADSCVSVSLHGDDSDAAAITVVHWTCRQDMREFSSLFHQKYFKSTSGRPVIT